MMERAISTFKLAPVEATRPVLLQHFDLTVVWGEGWNPQDSPIWRAVLGQWNEHQPNGVRQLVQQGRLKKELGRVLELKKSGYDMEEAKQLVLEKLSAEGAEPGAPEQSELSESELAALNRWQEGLAR